MGGGATESIPCGSEAEVSETTIEIKIKTMDSQTYTLKVDKEMPVPALKEQIASVTGVLSEQQRLICQGKVLKDDQLLSAYHVENGHTLHLVVRQPVPPSSEGLPSRSETDPGSSSGCLHGSHISPSSIVIETLSLPDQGEGVPPEISRIVSAVLGSFGFSSIGSGDGVEVVRNGQQRTSVASGTSDAVPMQSEQTGTRGQSQGSLSSFGLQTGLSLGSLNPPVILDSVTTLSQYVSRMRQEFSTIGVDSENSSQSEPMQSSEQNNGSSTSLSGSVQERLPTPAYLAEVMLSTRQLLTGQVVECLQNLATQLENQANITDPVVRTGCQSTAWRTGVQLHNLGAMLLELGRTITTLRLGRTPTDAVVNAGPSVFINSSGPNPLMVQPLPFQQGTSFSSPNAGSVQPGSGLVNGVSTGFLPRRIDIQIRRASGNSNREETSDNQQPSGQRNPGSGTENRGNQTSPGSTEGSVSRDAGVRVVPIRTMLAAVPGAFSRSSDSSASSLGVYYPVIGRFQNAVSGRSSGEQHHSNRQSTMEPATQQQNVERNTNNESLSTSSRSREPSTTRTINVNILSAGAAHNNNESDGQIPSSVMNLLQTLFPGGEIHAEDVTFHGTTSGSAPQSASTASAPDQTESRVTEEGVFLSNILREIVPLVSQRGNAESSVASAGEAETADHSKPPVSDEAENPDVGTSHCRDDGEQSLPNAKRQKRD